MLPITAMVHAQSVSRRHTFRALRTESMRHSTALLVARAWCCALLSPQLVADARASAPLLPGSRLQKALQDAASAGVPNFTIAPGEYNFSSQPLQLISATSMDIVAEGATIWFSPGGGVQLRDCTDVFIRGLTIDYTPTLSQGIVRSVDRTGSTSGDGTASFTAQFDPTFLTPPCPAASQSHCKVAFWRQTDATQTDSDGTSAVIVRNDSAPAAVNIFANRVERIQDGADHTYRVFVTGGNTQHGVELAQAGQQVTVFHGSNPHSYTALNCTRITLERVSIYGGTGMGIVDGQGGGDSTYRSVKITRRPLQRGIGGVALTTPVARLLATNEDGFHSNGNDIGPHIVDSTIAYTGDDSGNICTGMSVFLGQFSPDQSRSNHSSGASNTASFATFVDVQRNLMRAKSGDVLSFYHLNSMVKQGSVVVAGTPFSMHNNDAIADMRSGYAKMQAPPFSAHFVTHTKSDFTNGLPVAIPLAPMGVPENISEVSENMPAGVTPFWSLAVLESTDNSGARVHNSIFSDSYARAFMIKTQNSSFTNCTFRRAGGLHIGPEQAWLEGDPGIQNITVEDNFFVSCHRSATSSMQGLNMLCATASFALWRVS